MKTLLTLALIIFNITVYSQNKMIFSGALNAGAFAYADNLIGPSLGIDLEGRTNKFSIYFSATGNFLTDDSENRITEIIVGPRWYIGDLKKINGEIETGFGTYVINSGKNKFGINLGAGFNYPVSKDFDISIKGKYHLYSGGYGITHGNVYLSLRYYFNK